MGTENNIKIEERNTPEYLAQLLKDKKQIQAFPNVFLHAERLIDEEINKVRISLFHIQTSKENMPLPEASGPVLTLSEKVFVPNKEYPDFNFVGRILGPRGMTAKQLEQETGCKIMVRGKGSMRDKKKEEMNRGKPNWEHLNEELHVLITVEDSRNRADLKMKRAMDEVKKLLVPAPEGEDDLKKRQLMELAIINGTYRDTKCAPQTNTATVTSTQSARILGPPLAMPPQLRSPTPAGAPIIIAPRMAGLQQMTATSTAGLLNGGPPPLVSPADHNLIYGHYDPYAAMAHAALLEYPGLDQTGAGAVPKLRRTVGVREHPYTRVSLP